MKKSVEYRITKIIRSAIISESVKFLPKLSAVCVAGTGR